MWTIAFWLLIGIPVVLFIIGLAMDLIRPILVWLLREGGS
jgi:hypothetical protein